jgi:hypothetical protein
MERDYIMKLHYIMISAIALGLGGCTSLNNMNPLSSTHVIEESSYTSDEVPKWYINVQEDTDNKVFGAGTGISDDMQFSLDKAMHEAKIVMADKMAAKSSYQLSRFMSDNASGSLSKSVEKSQKVSNSGFKNIDVSDYIVVKKEILKEGSRYRSYVLLQLDKSNREQPNQFTSDDEATADQAINKLLGDNLPIGNNIPKVISE